MRSKLAFSRLLDVAEVLRDARLREVEDDLLGAVDELRRLSRPLHAEPGDLLSGPDQATERRHLAHDARVVGGVRGGGNERRQLVDADLAAGVLDLASLIELVDERDRVDGLAAAVERRAPRGRSSRGSPGRSRWPTSPR